MPDKRSVEQIIRDGAASTSRSGSRYADEMDIDLLRRLISTPGVSGREERIREVVRKEVDDLVDETAVDRLGNLVAHRRGKGPKVMLCAHMDTIGFVVQHIDEDGFLRVMRVGGFDPRTLVQQRVLVCGRHEYVGVISPAEKPIHLLAKEERERSPKMDDLFIDLTMPAKDVKANVRVGDQVVLTRETLITGDSLVSPYLDDRLGIYIILQALRRSANADCDIYAMFTVQEETGTRGARTGTFAIDPDIAVVVDTAIGADLPGVDRRGSKVNALGQGLTITIMDTRVISDPRLVDRFRDICEQNDLPYSLEALDCGSTDADGVQIAGRGVPVVSIGPSTRYTHTSNEVANIGDVGVTIDALVRFLETTRDFMVDRA